MSLFNSCRNVRFFFNQTVSKLRLEFHSHSLIKPVFWHMYLVACGMIFFNVKYVPWVERVWENMIESVPTKTPLSPIHHCCQTWRHQSCDISVGAEVGVLFGAYLLGLRLLEGEFQGGHGQLVGKEVNVSGQLERADSRRWAVPSSDTAEQLPLPERGREMWRGDQGREVVSRRPGWGLKLYPAGAVFKCLFVSQCTFSKSDPDDTVAAWLKAEENWSTRWPMSPGFNMAASFI